MGTPNIPNSETKSQTTIIPPNPKHTATQNQITNKTNSENQITKPIKPNHINNQTHVKQQPAKFYYKTPSNKQKPN